MPMPQDNIPQIFIRSIFLSCMAGIGCALITVIVFFVTGDRTLLSLGSVASLLCIGKSLTLQKTVQKKRYETIEGICYHVDYPVRRPYPKIQIEQKNGVSITLTLDRKQKIRHGHTYRFYFKQGAVPDPNDAIWFQSLKTDGIIGIEEIEDI